MCMFFFLLWWCSSCTRATQGRRLQTKRKNSCEYVVKITVNPTLDQLNIVVIGELSSWESILQSSCSCEEAARVKVISHQWNTKRMRMVRYKVSNMAGLVLWRLDLVEPRTLRHFSWTRHNLVVSLSVIRAQLKILLIGIPSREQLIAAVPVLIALRDRDRY